ncbi:MAG: hypothetical protein IJ586_08530, partial [Alloprevotella sp.]|nr:hypothetical protein [Alloprevotella sp.]
PRDNWALPRTNGLPGGGAMSRADAWYDAGDILSTWSLPWQVAREIALLTSLTQDQAEAKLTNALQQAIGELLYKYGDYGKDEE